MTIKELYETCSTIGEHTKWTLNGKEYTHYSEIPEHVKRIDIFLFDFDYIGDYVDVKMKIDINEPIEMICVYQLSYVKQLFDKYQMYLNGIQIDDKTYESLKDIYCFVDKITENEIYIVSIRLEKEE